MVGALVVLALFGAVPLSPQQRSVVRAVPFESFVAISGSVPQCSDGQDNDSDGAVDHPFDPGCESLFDDDESNDEPTTAGACKNGGWKRFAGSGFRNQGDCVSFVASKRGGTE